MAAGAGVHVAPDQWQDELEDQGIMTGALVGTRDALPAPAAPRLRPPGWRDPRLALGIVLVAASVGLGVVVVDGARSTVEVYAAARELVPGAALTAADVTVVAVAADGTADRYHPAQGIADGSVVVRTVGAGELLPVAAVGDAAAVAVRPVAVPAGPHLSAAIVAGSRVDLWHVPEDADAASATAPAPLVTGIEVAEVDRGGSALSISSGAVVHVLVPAEALPSVLAALAGPGAVTPVAVPGRT